MPINHTDLSEELFRIRKCFHAEEVEVSQGDDAAQSLYGRDGCLARPLDLKVQLGIEAVKALKLTKTACCDTLSTLEQVTPKGLLLGLSHTHCRAL